MNERIEQLKKLAIIRVNNPTVNSDGKTICDNWEEVISLSKFAELVVQECVVSINEMPRYTQNWLEEATIEDCIRAVKEHFGVE